MRVSMQGKDFFIKLTMMTMVAAAAAALEKDRGGGGGSVVAEAVAVPDGGCWGGCSFCVLCSTSCGGNNLSTLKINSLSIQYNTIEIYQEIDILQQFFPVNLSIEMYHTCTVHY
jgi:hypothetical protein